MKEVIRQVHLKMNPTTVGVKAEGERSSLLGVNLNETRYLQKLPLMPEIPPNPEMEAQETNLILPGAIAVITEKVTLDDARQRDHLIPIGMPQPL